MNRKSFFCVAIISKSKGVKGYFIVRSFLENHHLFNLELLDSNLKKFNLEKINSIGKGYFLCKSPMVLSRNEAQSLRHEKLFCKRSALKLLEINTFFIEDLLNLTILNHQSGEKIGYIKNIFNNSKSDVLEVVFFNSRGSKFFLFNEQNFPVVKEDSVTINSILYE